MSRTIFPCGLICAVMSFLCLLGGARADEAAAMKQDANHVRQLAVAMHKYAGDTTRGGLPPAAICNPSGKPLLSWRVELLPYLGHKDLYEKFHLNESWDSAHNHKLLAQMPDVYKIPAAPTPGGETHYRVFYGNGAVLDIDRPTPFSKITDGTSTTLLIVETTQSVPWTKPADIAYDPRNPVPHLASFYTGGAFAAFADGSVRLIHGDIPEPILRAMVTRDGGERLILDR